MKLLLDKEFVCDNVTFQFRNYKENLRIVDLHFLKVRNQKQIRKLVELFNITEGESGGYFKNQYKRDIVLKNSINEEITFKSCYFISHYTDIDILFHVSFVYSIFFEGKEKIKKMFKI